MRKTLALAIACAMLASMTVVAFADVTAASVTETKSIKVDETSQFYMENEDGTLEQADKNNLNLEPGDSFYIEILPENPGEDIPTKLANQYKVSTDWQTGKTSFDDAAITSKKIAEPTGKYITSDAPYGLEKSYESKEALNEAINGVKIHDNDDCDTPQCSEGSHMRALNDDEKAAALAKYRAELKATYKYVAQINTKSSYTTQEIDLTGTVKVVKKTTSSSSTASNVDVNAVVAYDRVSVDGDLLEVSNDAPVVVFDDAEGEVELTFGSNFSFTVNVNGQDELYLGYTEKPIGEVLDQNEEANVNFITFSSKPSFNRIGDFRIYADEDAFVYEVTANGLKKLDATYDEDSSAYVFETRTLTSYAISDMELNYEGSGETEDNSSSSGSSEGGSNNGGDTNNKPNPGTGSADVVSAAVAAAGISLVAAGAAAYKKVSKDEE